MIREMLVGDVDAIVGIIADHEAWDEPYARAYYGAYFDRVGAGSNGRELNFVAVVDEEVVGVCGFGPPKFPTEDVLWGSWLYVRKDHRAEGIGASLIQHALAEVRKLGVRKVYLDTSSDDIYATAVATYKSFGFTIEGQLKDFYDEGEDLIIMGAELNDLPDGSAEA